MMTEEKEIICIGCPIGCKVIGIFNAQKLIDIKGYQCERGREYAIKEFTNPVRVLSTTVRIEGAMVALLPVKTTAPIPKEMLFRCMKFLAQLVVYAPVKMGDVIVKDILGTGVDVVATRTLERMERKI